jgi:hypothetical protein
MLVADAQKEVRTMYAGGLFGQLVSGMVWLASAVLATWASQRSGILTLVVGGFMIFPITTLVLVLLRRPHSLSPANPFRYLAMQVAFVLPLSMPLLAPVAAYRLTLFYPAMMVLLGAHYLPFATLYGMKSFIALGALLIVSGIGIAFTVADIFSVGAWVTSVLLLLFAFIGWLEASRAAA